MIRRSIAPVLLLVLALSGCASHAAVAPPPHPTPGCSPPAGGRCAADVAWRGPIHLTSDGLRLHARVGCGGVLHESETADTVRIRLHVGKMPPGSMSCALLDVGVRLAAPLGNRTVVDAVTGSVVRVVPDQRTSRLGS